MTMTWIVIVIKATNPLCRPAVHLLDPATLEKSAVPMCEKVIPNSKFPEIFWRMDKDQDMCDFPD